MNVPDKIMFKYLDLIFKNANISNDDMADYWVKSVYDEYGVLMFHKNTLYIYFEILRNMSDVFSITYDEAKPVVGRWFEEVFLKKDNLKVKRVLGSIYVLK